MDKVYGVSLSPFVRKVLLTLEYKGISFEQEDIIPGTRKPEFLKKSPLGKIPVYEDEYVCLPDSSVICSYLEQKYPTPALYPNNPQDRAHALWLEEFADSKLAELLGGGLFFELLVAPKMMGRPTNHKVVNRTLKVLPEYLDYLENHIKQNNYLIPGTFSIADISVVCIFLNAEIAGYTPDAKHWPKLANYLEMVKSTDLFAARLEQEKPIRDMLAG